MKTEASGQNVEWENIRPIIEKKLFKIAKLF